MELYKASQQWATRPEDERFGDIETAYQQSLAYAQTSHEKTDVDPATLRVEADGKDIVLVGKGNSPATLTNWAFSQVSARAAAPASYLRTIPATLAAQNINYGLKARYSANTGLPEGEKERVNILAHKNGGLVVRALTSEKYTRIWNHEVLGRLRDFKTYGWDTPIPFQYSGMGDVSGNEHLKTIYVSDHDMFVFLVNNENRIAEPGNPDGLGRGFFVENSEVGASKLRITTFLYRYVCCNSIVWGAQDVSELAIKHVGNARVRMGAMWATLQFELTRYANESASELEAKIKSAKTTIIDTDREKVIDAIFNALRKSGGTSPVSRKQLEESQALAVRHADTDGDPNSVWGMAQGMTRFSQTIPYADAKMVVDKAAGRLIDMAF